MIFTTCLYCHRAENRGRVTYRCNIYTFTIADSPYSSTTLRRGITVHWHFHLVLLYYGVPLVFHGHKWILYVICRYPFMLQPENFRAMPKSFYEMGIFSCHILNFFNVMCKFVCEMLHLIFATFSSICNMSWSIHDNLSNYLICLKP